MNCMQNKIAVIGDPESIKGFAAIGFDRIVCETSEQANTVLRRAAETEQYSVIFMTEQMFVAAEKERGKYEDEQTPAILPIPGIGNNNGVGKQRLSAFVERAVGSDIIFNNN